MRVYRFVGLFLIIVFLATILVTPVLSATYVAQAVAPGSITTQGGSTSGALAALGILDQSGSQDTPASYMTFATPGSIYTGYSTFQFGTDVQVSRISTLLFQVNFKGPSASTQSWSWSIYNWKTGMWNKLGDSLITTENQWNSLTFRVRSFLPYISSGRELRIQFKSNNANGDAKLDYEAFHITYIPVAPTSTRPVPTAISTKGSYNFPITYTPSPTPTPTITPSPTITPTSTSTPTRTPTNTIAAPVSSVFFPVGGGGSDVISHQVVRTDADYLYLFANEQDSGLIRVYKTINTGLPNITAAFAAPIQFTESSNPISVDAVYDGGTIIHTLINTQNRQIKDYPFDTATNTFKPSITLATDGGSVTSGLYVGTSGVAGMVDTGGKLHIVYWTSGNHILHRAYTYNSATNTLTPDGAFLQLDTAGSANHPAIAVSPVDNSVTIAWVSQATNPARILARTRASNGTWGGVEIASTAPVWTSSDNGINIDQGPSLLIDAAGVKHLAYIQSFDASVGDYGRVHYVSNNGSGWVDQALAFFSHDPALALSTSGNFYIIGHGHPKNTGGDAACRSGSSSMNNMCTIKQNANGTWGSPVLFATPPSGSSFDASPSVKWSAVGFNRSNAVEFVFFRTPYDSPTLYYGRLP